MHHVYELNLLSGFVLHVLQNHRNAIPVLKVLAILFANQQIQMILNVSQQVFPCCSTYLHQMLLTNCNLKQPCCCWL